MNSNEGWIASTWRDVLGLASAAVVLLPYLAFGWLFQKAVDGGTKEFLVGAGILAVLRGIFALTERCWAALQWSWGNFGNHAHERAFRFLSAHPFPNPSTMHYSGYLDYLERLKLQVTECDPGLAALADRELRSIERELLSKPLSFRKRYSRAQDMALTAWLSKRFHGLDSRNSVGVPA